MESKVIGQSKKGKCKGPNKSKGKSEDLASQTWKKDLSKIKCFICHKKGNYASQFSNKKKGKEKQ